MANNFCVGNGPKISGTTTPRKSDFPGCRVGSAVEEDGDGNVWIGATSDHNDSALIRYRRDGEFRVFTQAEGAPSGWIQDLFIDSRGRLWIASANDGVWRLDDPEFRQLRVCQIYAPPTV